MLNKRFNTRVFIGVLKKLFLSSSTDEWDQIRQKARDAAAKFSQKKEQRYRLYMRAFKHISQKIDSIYKELTKTPGVNVGGTAYLTLESIEEPYLSGIKCAINLFFCVSQLMFVDFPPFLSFRSFELCLDMFFLFLFCGAATKGSTQCHQ
jgi:hypothetical protein